MSQKTTTKRRLPTFLIVLLAAIGLTTVFVMIPPNHDKVPDKQLPWNSHYNANGALEALGLVVNQSTVQEAKMLFGDDVEVKIFSKKDETGKSAEAYFPSMHIATIHGALAIGIAVPENQLNAFYAQGVQTTVTPNGNRQVTPNTDDIQVLMSLPIASVTLIPRKNLTQRAIEMRFGKPQRIENQSDGLEHWFYPEKGLELLYDENGPEALQYVPGLK
ncbi:MAG: hypothetical protein ACP5D0_05415 [Hydrogenovibrio sp.]